LEACVSDSKKQQNKFNYSRRLDSFQGLAKEVTMSSQVPDCEGIYRERSRTLRLFTRKGLARTDLLRSE
jgi:hypothetical protein